MKELEHPTNSVPKGKRFCTICGEIKREHNFEGDSTHCKACCERMRHTRPRWYGILCFALLLAVAVAAGSLLAQTLPFCTAQMRAEALARDRYLNDACTAFEDVFSRLSDFNDRLFLRFKAPEADEETGETPAALPSVFNAGTKSWERYVRVYLQAYSKYDAAQMLQQSIDAARLKENALFADCVAAQTAYTDVYQVITDASEANPFSTPEDMPYREIVDALDQCAADHADEPYYDAFVNLFKASAAQYSQAESPDDVLAMYDKAAEMLPDESATILGAKVQIAAASADWQLMEDTAREALAYNRNTTEAYEWIVYAAAKRGDTAAVKEAAAQLHSDMPDSPIYEKLLLDGAILEKDLNEAHAVLDECKTRLDEKAAALFNTLLADRALPDASQRFLKEYMDYVGFEAIVYLLDGDVQKAHDAAFEHGFNYGYYLEYLTGGSAITSQISDLAWLTSTLLKNEEALNTIGEFAPNSEWVQKIADGTMTVEQAFLEGGADLA